MFGTGWRPEPFRDQVEEGRMYVLARTRLIGKPPLVIPSRQSVGSVRRQDRTWVEQFVDRYRGPVSHALLPAHLALSMA